MKEKNPGGRPKKYDLTKEAKDLDNWSKNKDSYSLYEFTFHKDYLATELSKFASQSPEFSQSLKKAKERIVCNREQGVNANVYNYGLWNRNARVYDSILKLTEDEDLDAEARRKKDIISNLTPETVNKFDELMKLISTLQSARKMANNSIKADAKS